MAADAHLARLLIGIAFFFIISGAGACSQKQPSPAAREASSATIVAVNYPLAYFAERLAPDGSQVRLLPPSGVDPAFWTPSPEQINELQRADLILLNGAGYARWTRVATLPRGRVVVTADGCVDAFLPSGDAGTHRHGPEGEHAHEATAFTTWLDLGLARCQAEHAKDALVRRLPTEARSIEARFSALARDLDALDGHLRRTGKALRRRPIIASHPVYQYLAAAYHLNVESLHLEPDEPLDPAASAELDALLERHPASLMLWEAAPRSETAQALRQRGLEVVVFEPAGNRPEAGDFSTVMRANADRLACAAGADTCPR